MANVREEAVPSVLADTDLSELSWLVGAWSVDGDAAKAEITYEWMANKHFLRGDTTVTKDGNSTSGGVQIIGRDPESGRIVSWFFNADGGHGYGEWYKEGPHWIINTRGTTADGVPTTATNVLYCADNNVMSWQSMNRAIGETNLPDQKEIVIERIGSGQ